MQREPKYFRATPAYDDAMPTLPRDKQAAEVKDQEPFRVPNLPDCSEPFKAPAHAGEFAELGMMAVAVPYMSPAEEASYWSQRRKDGVASMVALPPSALAAMENCLAAEGMGLASTAQAEASLGHDSVTLPAHYARFKVEPIHFICANGLNFFQGNIVKYVLRHDAKNGLEDLRKARRYLDMFIKFQEGDEGWWR